MIRGKINTIATNGKYTPYNLNVPTVAIAVGITVITGGTNTRILYNNSGVVGEYTLTGTGTVVVMQTAPTFITSITTPITIGGTGTTSTIIIRSTSGVGTTGADIIFQTGNNGATEVARMLNAGNVLIGATTLIGTEMLSVQKNQNAATRLTVSNSTAGTASQAALYLVTSGGVGLDINLFSASFTTSGSAIAGTARISSAAPSGFSIGTSNSSQLMWRTGGTEWWRLDPNGNINNTGATGSTKALLEIASTTKGVLISRMTTVQKNAITSPPEGLIVFDTTLHQISYYNATTWVNI